MANEPETIEKIETSVSPEVETEKTEVNSTQDEEQKEAPKKTERIKFGELTTLSKVMFGIILLLCVAVGGAAGVAMHYKTIILEQESAIKNQSQDINLLEQEKTVLQDNIAQLEDTVRIMSETIAQKNQSESNLDEEFKKLFIPTEFPLTGAASMDVVTEGEPACIITSGEDAMVVASAGGTILSIDDDAEYLHCIRVDHGNGYVSVYKNAGEVKVKQGETVNKGNTLFCIRSAGSKVYFQIFLDGEAINPMDVLIING